MRQEESKDFLQTGTQRRSVATIAGVIGGIRARIVAQAVVVGVVVVVD